VKSRDLPGIGHGSRSRMEHKWLPRRIKPEPGIMVALSGLEHGFGVALGWRRGAYRATADPLKIPDRLPTSSQAVRLRVAWRELWPKEPIDIGGWGEKAEGRRKKAEKSRGNGEIGGGRAKLNRPSRERRRSEYVAGDGQGGWPAMNSWGRSCQSTRNWLARRNNTGPTGG
jgi:hypothetical protein